MRRPTLCCDHQSTVTAETGRCNKDQGGAFARMRRLFLSTPLGRRSSPLGQQCSKPTCHHHRGSSRHHEPSSRYHDSSLQHDSSSRHRGASSPCQRDASPCERDTSPCERGSSPRRCVSSSRDLPALRLHDSLVVIQHEVIGTPLEEAVRGGNTPHGVPLLVYELCSYILNHDVNLSPLIYEEWCSSEVVATLERHPRCSALEAGSVAPLLRLFLEQLPQPLLPPHTLTTLLSLAEMGELSPPVVGDNNSVCRARRLLLRDLPPANLCLLRYLTAFLACMQHANKCDGTWVLLGVCMVGSVGERRCVGKPLAEYLLDHCHAIFPEDRQVFLSASCTDDTANSSDTSNPALTSQDDDSSGTAGGATTNDEDDEDSSSTASSRSSSRATTSEGTEDFRSPQISPTKVPGDDYVLLSEDVIMPAEDVVMSPEMMSPEDVVVSPEDVDVVSPEEDVVPSEDCNHAEVLICSKDLPLKKRGGLVSAARILSADAECDEPFQFIDEDVLPSEDLKIALPKDEMLLLESKEDDSTSSSRSTNNGDLATLPLPFSCDIKGDGGGNLHWEKKLSANIREDPDTETGVEESDGTSCPLSDPWDDFTSAGEVYLAGVSSEDAPIPDEGDPGMGELYMGEAHRLSERIYYPVRSASVGDHPSPQHRSKRKKSRHRRHSKVRTEEGGALWASNDSIVGDKLPPSRTQSEEEDNTADSNHSVNSGPYRQDSLSSLLDHNEPAVACDRGRWTAERDDDHRTALRFSRYAEDEDKHGGDNGPFWYKYDRSAGLAAVPERGQTYDPIGGAPYEPPRFEPVPPSALSSSAFMKAVTGKSSSGSSTHRNISSIKKRIKRFEEDFENKFGYKPSHSEKMKHKDIKKYMSDLSKARKELKMMKEGVADLVSSKGFSLSLLRCQESTQNHLSNSEPLESAAPMIPLDSKTTLLKVEDRLRESRSMDRRPQELTQMTVAEMQDEKIALQKALLYYESVHGRPNTREARELARPLYDRYRQVKRSVSRAQARAKENINELAPIIEHVAMDFTLASPQHRSSLTPESQPVEQLLLCKEKLLAVQRKQQQQIQQPAQLSRQDSDELEEEDEDDDRAQEGSLSDSSDVSKQSSMALSNLHSLPLHELKERRREAKDHKKKLRRSLRQFEERYEREHGHKLVKEERGPMEQTYLDYKHAKAKLRLLEALISKKAPKEDEF